MNLLDNKEEIINSALILVFFSALYFTTISDLIKDWSNDPDFSHGFIIPFISGFMIWLKKDKLKGLPIKPSFYGLIILLLGMCLFIAGNLGAELFVMRFSMIITICGIIIFLLGFKIFKEVFIPVLYLVFMIPVPAIIWNKIAFPLQLFAARASENTIQFFNIPVFREGNILHISSTSLEVVDACSGLRSLTSLTALSAAFAYLSALSTPSKIILFLSAIPIAVAVNIIRLTITAFTAEYIGPETAHGFLHEISGVIVFASAILLLYLGFLILEKIEKKINEK